MIAILNISSLTEINFIEILFHQFMSIWFWAAFWTKISTNQEHMKYSEFSFFFFHQTKFLFSFIHDSLSLHFVLSQKEQNIQQNCVSTCPFLHFCSCDFLLIFGVTNSSKQPMPPLSPASACYHCAFLRFLFSTTHSYYHHILIKNYLHGHPHMLLTHISHSYYTL